MIAIFSKTRQKEVLLQKGVCAQKRDVLPHGAGFRNVSFIEPRMMSNTTLFCCFSIGRLDGKTFVCPTRHNFGLVYSFVIFREM